jgi:S1-C subfamily serine protease
MSLAVCTLMWAPTVSAQTDFRQALRLAFPATVAVSTAEADQADPAAQALRRQMGPFGGWQIIDDLAGSSAQTGFAVGENLIATQLPSAVEEVTITTADGKELPGKVVTRDYVTGLTLVKVDGHDFVNLIVGAGLPEAGLPIAVSSLDESGTPYGEMGMIASGLSTAASQLGFTQSISAKLNRSAAGAPIVDAAGVVVGVVGVQPNAGLLCLPTERLISLIDRAAADQPSDVKRGLVGVVFARDGEPVVTDVSPGKPAAESGIKTNDRIVRVGDYAINKSQDVLAAVAMFRAGDDVPIVIERSDQNIELVIKLEPHPRQEFAMSDRAAGQMARQAWELRNGQLVPLEGGDAGLGGALKGLMQPQDLENLFENFPNNNRLLPGLPRRLDDLKDEDSELEDEPKTPDAGKQDREDQLQEMQRKLRELQEQLQDS